jgi:hypothetical protein
LKEGDKNTKYFHRIANPHRRKNSIGQLAINGEVFTDPTKISSRIVEFYKTLFTDVGVRQPTFDNLPCAQLDSNDAGSLDRIFTEEEVAEAVKNMNGDKAPSPDGFLPILLVDLKGRYYADFSSPL